MRSGTSATTCYVVSANILYIFIVPIHDARHSKHRSRAIGRLSKGRKIHALLPGSPVSMFAFVTQQVVIEVPECTLDCPEPKTLKKLSY